MTTKKRIVILGAGYAGLLASVRLAGKVKAKDVHITLINASSDFVERVRMHQVATNQSIKKHPIDGFLRGKAVDFIRGWVTGIDPTKREVHLKTDDDELHIEYDNLVYALGSHIDRSRVEGAQEFAYSLNADSVAKLHEVLPEVVNKQGKLAVIGGGLTGIEAATEFAETYPQLQVSLLTRGGLGDNLSQKGKVHLYKVFARLGIQIHEHVSVERIEQYTIHLQDNDVSEFDICLWSAGFAVPQLAKQSGITVNHSGRVIIDAEMRSVSHPEIFAIGDSSVFADHVGLQTRMSCATAMPMGAHAVDNLVELYKDRELKPFAFGYILQCISLGRHDALIQLVESDDTPKDRIFTGRLGKFIKEIIVIYTIAMTRWERRFPGLYTWAKSIEGKSTQVSLNQEQVTAWNSLNNTAQ